MIYMVGLNPINMSCGQTQNMAHNILSSKSTPQILIISTCSGGTLLYCRHFCNFFGAERWRQNTQYLVERHIVSFGGIYLVFSCEDDYFRAIQGRLLYRAIQRRYFFGVQREGVCLPECPLVPRPRSQITSTTSRALILVVMMMEQFSSLLLIGTTWQNPSVVRKQKNHIFKDFS